MGTGGPGVLQLMGSVVWTYNRLKTKLVCGPQCWFYFVFLMLETAYFRFEKLNC